MASRHRFHRYPRTLEDVRPQADSWNGPYFRLFSCGINDYRETPPPHGMFLDAMEPLGCWEYVLSGSIYYKLGGERYRVDAGQAVISRRPDPGWMLRPVGDVPVQVIWTAVTGDMALRMFDFLHLKFGQIQTLPLDSHPVRLAGRLVNLVAAEPKRSAHFWSQKTVEWMNAWWQCADEHHAGRKRIQLNATRPSRLISYAPKTIKNFATEMGYSVAHLSRKLSKQWHRSPGKVLREVRLNDAAMLLRTTRLNINEIATKIGYSSPAAFSRAFIKMHQQTPSAYRRGG